MKQTVEEQTIYKYKLQPGDATLYEFYILSEGWGNFLIVVNMGYSKGTISINNIDFGKEDDLPVYLTTWVNEDKYFQNVDQYTKIAILYACRILFNDPYAVEEAAQEMLRARDYFANKAKGEQNESE